MSILTNLARAREAYRQQPLLMLEAGFIAEYDAAKRAYASALALSNLEGALFWRTRANTIARAIAQIEAQNESTEAMSA
ncbi:MAG: hypothetical protein JXB30_09895 [Anaerolineae bacterium]|nr:hypothetical protein [Anaerolineae bacterium]